MDDGVIDPRGGLGGTLVRRYLERRPEVVAALRDKRACLVVVDGERWSPAPGYFATTQRALDEAEAAVPSEVWPVFLVLTSLVAAVATGAFELGRRAGVPAPALTCRRGRVLGYLAIGEGGLVFFDAAGVDHGAAPPLEAVLAAISAAPSA